MKISLAALFTLLFLGWATTRIVMDINFGRNCTGYLKRAADANTVPMAAKNLETAVRYAETNGLTSGYTSILYRSPSEDIGFWYENLTASLKELKEITPETTQLERTNVLMKLRETLLDQGENGVHVTAPSGLSVYPSNTAFALWGCLSLIFAGVFWIAGAMDL